MDSQLEQYLDEVAGRLEPLPVARRNEELREVRQHLQNAVIVNREMGMSEDEAAAKAVEQLGPPEEAAQGLIEAWRRGDALQDRRSLWRAVGCSLAAILVVPRLLIPLATQYLTRGGHPTGPWFYDCCMAINVLACLAAGGVTWWAFKTQGVKGTAIALALPSLFFGGILEAMRVSGAAPQLAAIPTGDFLRMMILGASSNAPVTLLAAWAGQRWRERRDAHPTTARAS